MFFVRYFVRSFGRFFARGGYATLRELLIASDGKMGFTRHLDDADLHALIAYLKML